MFFSPKDTATPTPTTHFNSTCSTSSCHFSGISHDGVFFGSRCVHHRGGRFPSRYRQKAEDFVVSLRDFIGSIDEFGGTGAMEVKLTGNIILDHEMKARRKEESGWFLGFGVWWRSSSSSKSGCFVCVFGWVLLWIACCLAVGFACLGFAAFAV